MKKEKQKAEVLLFVLPGQEWMLDDSEWKESEIIQANCNLAYRWRHRVLDCEGKHEAQSVALALLQYLDTYRDEFRRVGQFDCIKRAGARVFPPIVRELEELLPYNRWKLNYLTGRAVTIDEKYRPEIIPIDQLYREAAKA